MQFILAPFTNNFITHRISQDLRFFRDMKTTDADQEKLLAEILEYPKTKTMEVLVTFSVYGLLFLVILFVQYRISVRTAVILYVSCACCAYFSAVVASYVIAQICCTKATAIISRGENKEHSAGKKAFRYSLTTLFFIYIILPLVADGILTFAFVRYNAGSAETMTSLFEMTGQLAVVSAMEVCMTSLLALLFFLRIRRYNSIMQKALRSIDKDSVMDAHLLPVDLFTEISYSMYLINQTIIMFRTIMHSSMDINRQLTADSQSLSAIVKESETTSVSQLAGIEEILATMRNSSAQTTMIEKKIKEVNNVAVKTKENVDSGFESVRENGMKMQEIIQANQSTIAGIQSLNNKINSIWDIVNLIDSVADQTKIIAFNAELETENMQEGRDRFENVASEIRSLADSVMKLTGEIRSQIQEIQHSSSALIVSGQTGSQKFAEGSELILALEEKFAKIDDSARLTASSAKVIQQIIAEQQQAFDGIVEKLEQINASLENFKSAANNISNTVQELGNNSDHLSTLYVSKENA